MKMPSRQNSDGFLRRSKMVPAKPLSGSMNNGRMVTIWTSLSSSNPWGLIRCPDPFAAQPQYMYNSRSRCCRTHHKNRSPKTCFLPGEVHPLQGENDHEEGYHFKWFGGGLVQQGGYEEKPALEPDFWLNNWYLPILIAVLEIHLTLIFSNTMKPIRHDKKNMRWV